MDNGTCNSFWERAKGRFAIGRNTWLFSDIPGDSRDGANASSVLYSFVVTAKLNGVNPYPYEALHKIFDPRSFCPQRYTPIEDYERLADFLLCPETQKRRLTVRRP